MRTFFLLCAAGVLAAVLSLTLKKDAPVIAFLLVLAAGVVLLLRLGEAAQSTMQRFSALLARGDLSAELYGPVLRVVGIAVLVRILAALCRDAFADDLFALALPDPERRIGGGHFRKTPFCLR